ncbi:MAG: alpha/beta hydrolase [Acidimicrobiales bacterium]|nr:alpha/beta hydrolase [Acidimicrobiales bacterium]
MGMHRVVEGAGARVVLVHGFTQTLMSWAPVAADLAGDHEVVRVDAPGHGGSGDLHVDLAAGAELLGAAGGRATYVGYSMGARLALRLAIDRPDLVERLVLIGATAGIDDPDERSARRAADDALAARIEADGVDAFLDRWLAQPLFADLSPTPEDLAARRTNTAAGLASSLRLAGTGTMDPPWWDDLARIDAPTLVLAGEHDAKFTALGHRLVAAIGARAGAGAGPVARFAPVAGAGHAAHLQRPALVASRLRAHLGPS